MKLSDLKIDRNALEAICRRFGIRRLEAFGSFARGDAGPQSDLDLLATYEPDAKLGLKFVSLQEELEHLVGRKVDLLTRVCVEQSPNRFFRRFALRHVAPLYECA